VDELRLWLASKTYNQCPAFWERIDLGVSRQCPLAAARSSVKSGLPVEESPSSVLRMIRELHKRFDS